MRISVLKLEIFNHKFWIRWFPIFGVFCYFAAAPLWILWIGAGLDLLVNLLGD